MSLVEHIFFASCAASFAQQFETPMRAPRKAEAGEAGEAWSNSQIAGALDTGLATIARTRQQLVEVTRNHSPTVATSRILILWPHECLERRNP